jgi:hypothetical protein
MVRIRRFNVLKTSTVVAVMYVVIVAIFAIPFLLIVGIAGVSTNDGPNVGIGWVFTAVACLIYNLVAGWIGGIEVEVDRVEPPAPPPAWMAPGGSPTAPPGPPPSAPIP